MSNKIEGMEHLFLLAQILMGNEKAVKNRIKKLAKPIEEIAMEGKKMSLILEKTQ